MADTIKILLQLCGEGIDLKIDYQATAPVELGLTAKNVEYCFESTNGCIQPSHLESVILSAFRFASKSWDERRVHLRLLKVTGQIKEDLWQEIAEAVSHSVKAAASSVQQTVFELGSLRCTHTVQSSTQALDRNSR